MAKRSVVSVLVVMGAMVRPRPPAVQDLLLELTVMDAHLRDLRYFVAVAEELSFTRAATERLFISQPALSKQIRQLESLLRVALFERDRRTVALTPAGETLLPRARALLEAWDVAQREVADAAATSSATLVVGFQTSIGRGLVPAITTALAELLPTWTVRFRQVAWDDPRAGLGDGGVDAAIAWLPLPEGAELRSAVLATEHRWVALPARHRLARRRRVPFAELVDEPFVALPASAGALRQFWLASDQRSSPARVALEVSTAEETFEAVASGVGVALLSAGNAAIYQREGVTCRPVDGLPPSQLAIVWRSSDHRHALRVLVQACTDQPRTGAAEG